MNDLEKHETIQLIQLKYGKLIRAVAFEVLKDWQYVEDVEQEVLCKLVMRHEEIMLLPSEELKNYLCAAVKNTAINMGIKNGRITQVEEQYIRERFNTQGADLRAFYDKYGFGPEVVEVLSLLENIDREIIYLQYGEGYSRKEIAQKLGKNEEFVKKRVYRARKKLKKLLTDQKRNYSQ